VSPLIRVLLDANLLISVLLTAERRSAPTIIVGAALNRVIILLLADEILAEVRDKIAAMRYLRERIQQRDVARLWAALLPTAELLPRISGPVPRRGRDPKDDYLLILAERGHADFLVTGDKDLLVLANESFPFKIISPGDFLHEFGLV
jgi:putative PIN family toxin of toxin-antitoxin system